ncbi:MAG: zinc ribbon domain-containing protein [Deltaproteobacteria bacterium]|nr:zinc ribbon domain-containing protein [Deltaproteobacteria bacterium]
MPIYEYHCNKCSNDFEELVFSRNPEIECPRCQSRDVGRLLSVVSFSTGAGQFSSSAGSSCGSCSASSCAGCGSSHGTS